MDNSTEVDVSPLKERSYFTIIPNMIDNLNLSPYAFRLYFHIRKVAGEGGHCSQNTSSLAKVCSMSTGMVVSAKDELEKSGLIMIEKISNSQGFRTKDKITVIDIWKENFTELSLLKEKKSENNPVVHVVNDVVHTVNDCCSCGDTVKEEPIKEDLKESNIKINCELKLAGDSSEGFLSGRTEPGENQVCSETKLSVPPRPEPEYVPVSVPRIGGFGGLAKLSREDLEYQPVKTKTKSPQSIRHELEEFFSGLTSIPMVSDYKERNRLWWKPLNQILGWYEGDVLKASNLIRDTIQEMEDAKLVISSPNSILNNAVNLFRKEPNGKETSKTTKTNVTGVGREIRY